MTGLDFVLIFILCVGLSALFTSLFNANGLDTINSRVSSAERWAASNSGKIKAIEERQGGIMGRLAGHDKELRMRPKTTTLNSLTDNVKNLSLDLTGFWQRKKGGKIVYADTPLGRKVKAQHERAAKKKKKKVSKKKKKK